MQMQSKTADLAPVPPPGRTRQNIEHDFGPLALICENKTSFTIPEVHNVLLFPSEQDRAVTTGNMFRIFGEIWTVVSEICETTYRHAW